MQETQYSKTQKDTLRSTKKKKMSFFWHIFRPFSVFHFQDTFGEFLGIQRFSISRNLVPFFFFFVKNGIFQRFFANFWKRSKYPSLVYIISFPPPIPLFFSPGNALGCEVRKSCLQHLRMNMHVKIHKNAGEDWNTWVHQASWMEASNLRILITILIGL